MEKFLEAAIIAWNPVGEVRRRIETKSLTVGAVLVPCIGIVIVCNLFAAEAQKFFFDSLLNNIGSKLPDYPITGNYAMRMWSAIGVFVPIGAVSLLPAKAFNPHNRSEIVATMLVVFAAGAFYSAAIQIPFYFFQGVLAFVNLELLQSFLMPLMLFAALISIVLIGLYLFFWYRITLSVLKLSGVQVVVISLVTFIAIAMEAGVVFFIILASTT